MLKWGYGIQDHTVAGLLIAIHLLKTYNNRRYKTQTRYIIAINSFVPSNQTKQAIIKQRHQTKNLKKIGLLKIETTGLIPKSNTMAIDSSKGTDW